MQLPILVVVLIPVTSIIRQVKVVLDEVPMEEEDDDDVDEQHETNTTCLNPATVLPHTIARTNPCNHVFMM